MVNKGTIFKWVLLVLLVAYCAAVTVWASGEASRHVVTGIDIVVEGDAMMDSVIRHGVLQELQHYPKRIVGAQMSSVNTSDVERYLSEPGNLERVNCMMSSGGRLKIDIVPLIPVMRVFDGDRSYYVNKDGRKIDSRAEFYADVPVVKGRFTKKFRPEEVIPLVRFVNRDETMRELTGMIVARDRNNLMVVPRLLGHVVNFGDTSDLSSKARSLELFYRKVMPYKGWEEYDTISVKYRGQIVATRRDKSRVSHQEELADDLDPEELTLTELAPEAVQNAPQEATRQEGGVE